LEEAKLRRQPPEKELSGRMVVVVGGGSGIGREAAILAAQRGAHVIIADYNLNAAKDVTSEITALGSRDQIAVEMDIRDRASIRFALEEAVIAFGGFDVVLNTAAVFLSSAEGLASDEQWTSTLAVNVTANYLLVDEAKKILQKQDIDTSIVLTSSANAVVAKRGTEAYDVSKAAVSHLVRELAVALAPKIRVNGISPATVVKGSTMFPRDRVLASLKKYDLEHDETMSDESLRGVLADFYAERTLTKKSIDPRDCAVALLFLAASHSRCTTGHLFPIDGGLPEAFLR
jgi:NAD(P)-dependent dehydrogenase (short-subunit alcohol dehydrogenase family)